MSERQESYLGDGLYASFDGFALWLRAPREHGDHVVCLEPLILKLFIEYAIRVGVLEPPKGFVPELVAVPKGRAK